MSIEQTLLQEIEESKRCLNLEKDDIPVEDRNKIESQDQIV